MVDDLESSSLSVSAWLFLMEMSKLYSEYYLSQNRPFSDQALKIDQFSITHVITVSNASRHSPRFLSKKWVLSRYWDVSNRQYSEICAATKPLLAKIQTLESRLENQMAIAIFLATMIALKTFSDQ